MTPAPIATLQSLYAHDDWANAKLRAVLPKLTAEQLDRKFEMGLGTLRETVRHLYGAERIWLERWVARPLDECPRARDVEVPGQLDNAWHTLAEIRNAFVAGLQPIDLQRRIRFTSTEGSDHDDALGGLMLHVCIHGIHHRAQALNMVRHAGVESGIVGLDYLFYRLVQPTLAQEPAAEEVLKSRGHQIGRLSDPPAYDLDIARTLLRFGDWADGQLVDIAAELEDAALDRPFEMGLGTLRKTLLHILDAEEWWTQNWTADAPRGFDKLPETTPIAELRTRRADTLRRRDAYLDTVHNDDLQRGVTVEARPGFWLRFRLGESLLQLGAHGTHHRAQAVNMLRHLGTPAPGVDYLRWFRAS